MTDGDINRAIGHIEGKLEGIIATLARVDTRSQAAEESRGKMQHDIAELKDHAAAMIIVTQQFNALQQAIRDGKNQAKGMGKGIGMGIAIAAASGGAAVASIGKELWKFLFG